MPPLQRAMAAPYVFLLLLLSSISFSESKLNTQYYAKTCPDFDRIMRETITTKQMTTPSTAAATLRLFSHDCLVEGCDASVLVSSNSFNKAERDADINLSLGGDAFDVVTRAKTALELACPGIVSCADILAHATRDLVTMVGGPFYQVKLGRKDGLVSRATSVEGNLARSNMTIDQIINMFATKGFSVQEMVALLGGHTIGFSHCSEFSDRVYNYRGSKTGSDPGYNPKYAEGLKKVCQNQTKNPAMAAFLDPITPGKFDNMYYKNLPRGLGLLKSDHAMVLNPRTRPFVKLYAQNQNVFFRDFAKAMEKLSVYGIKTGKNGEVRHRCDAFNNLNA